MTPAEQCAAVALEGRVEQQWLQQWAAVAVVIAGVGSGSSSDCGNGQQLWSSSDWLTC